MDFRDEAHKVADLAADYLERLEKYDVLPKIAPGDVKAQLSPSPPTEPESMDAILADYKRLIEPNITHWQHPMFMAYFPSIASPPAILGEWLAATLNSNVMLWRNAPSSTELEQLVVSWLAQMLGLSGFDGMLTDTASISSLLSVVAARHAVPGLHAKDEGLSGRKPLRMYASTEAHSSVEKAAIVAGIGRHGFRRIAVDEEYRMRPELLEAAIAADRAEGDVPFCVVATLGTTSTTSVDPCSAIAEICKREKLWLHVDAAYAGTAAILPDMRHHFSGWEHADSIVVNPHKWMFTPFDASLLLFRSPESFRDAFSLVPEYLKTAESPAARNYNEYGIQLGRRFRALKLWMQIRAYGVEGIGRKLREHMAFAQSFASWVRSDAAWELCAPVPFATVCYRFRGDDAKNERILDRVNASGRAYISHTKLGGRYVLRASFGNPLQTEEHVRRLWDLLREAASAS